MNKKTKTLKFKTESRDSKRTAHAKRQTITRYHQRAVKAAQRDGSLR